MSGIKIKTAKNGDPYITVVARNGRVLMHSETYQSGMSSAINGIKAIEKAINDNQFEIRMAINNEPYFVLKANNGEILLQSETYRSGQRGVLRGINSVRDNCKWT